MLPRYKRALSEPIDFALVESGELTGGSDLYEVIGSTGKKYTVMINKESKSECNCVDYTMRGGKMCKHIMCILLKAYGLNINALRELENNPHFALIDVPNTSISGDACECPICFGAIEIAEWQCAQCRKGFHTQCISSWFSICRAQNMKLSCPHCRDEI